MKHIKTLLKAVLATVFAILAYAGWSSYTGSRRSSMRSTN